MTKRVRRLFSFLGLIFSLIVMATCVCAEYSEGMEFYRKAWAAYSTQQFNEAESWVKKAIRADPQNAHAMALQGDLFYLRHHLQEAYQAWAKAVSLNPQLMVLKERMDQAKLEESLEGELQSIQWESLTIRVPASLSQEETQKILEALTQASETLKPFFQYHLERPMTVLVYPTQMFYSTTHLPTEVLGLFDGKVRIPLSSTHQPEVLWHELTHVLVYDLSHGRAPRWLQEGLAQVGEEMADSEIASVPAKDRWRVPRNDRGTARRAVGNGLASPSQDHDGERPSLEQLFGISERFGEPVTVPAGAFYQGSYELVQYLLQTWGWDKMRLFLSRLGAGKSVEEALDEVYGWDLKTLEKKWKSS